MFILKVYETEKGKVVAACDEDILGKTFEEGYLVLNVSKGFFEGRSATLKEIKKEIEACHTANIAGNKIVERLARDCVFDIECARTVGGQKHVMIFK